MPDETVMFRIGKSARDERVRFKLQRMKDRGENISEYIKSLIDEDGKAPDEIARLRGELSALTEMLQSGHVVISGEPAPESGSDRASALDGFMTQ